MEKTVLTVISSDWHIKLNNIDRIVDLIQQKIDLAKKLETTNLICLGDVFQSRQAQPLSVLKCFEYVLNLIDRAGMVLYCIAGNHDKINYSSEDSYLDQYQWHPALKLIRNILTFRMGDFDLHFIPFFEESLWCECFGELLESSLGLPHGGEFTGKDILLSHQAISGSMNNDGTKIENSLRPLMFKGFFKVFLGHYHNQQQMGENIFHLPSLQANNFGEDNEKGFTVLYDDGSHELVISTFSEYCTIKINLDKINELELNDIKRDAAILIEESGANVRFKFEGSEDKVQAIKSEEFTTFGIDVKKEYRTIVKSIEKAETGEVITYDNKTILRKFDIFCEEEKYNNVKYGRNCLVQKLKENE